MAQIVTGLDIGSDSVKLVQVRHGRGDAHKVISYGMMEIQGAGEAASGSSPVTEAIRKLLSQSKIHPTHLVTTLPKQGVVVKYLSLPTPIVSEIPQIIRFEAGKHVPFYTDEDIVDFELIGTSPLGGSEILLVVCRRDIVQEHLNMLRSLHLEPLSIDVSSLALMRALKAAKAGAFKEPNKTLLVMDFGSNYMELSLVQNRVLKYTRTANIGGNLLIRNLQESLGLSEKDAKSILPQIDLSKPNYGVERLDKEKLGDAINSWMERVDTEIKRSIDYFSNEFGISQIHSIILSGGLARLASFPESLEKELGIPVKLVNFVTNTKTVTNTDLLPELNTAYGLALRKPDLPLGGAVNLLPPEVLRKRILRKRQGYFAKIGIGVLCVLVGLGVFSYRKYSDMETSIDRISKELQMRKPKAEKLADMQKQLDSVKKMINQTDIGVETLAGLSKTDMIPTKVTIERLNYERNKIVSMTCVGLNMEDAVNFRFNVEQLGFFKVVEIQNANTDTMEGKPVVRFQLVCKIKPDKEEASTDKSDTSKESSPGE